MSGKQLFHELELESMLKLRVQELTRVVSQIEKDILFSDNVYQRLMSEFEVASLVILENKKQVREKRSVKVDVSKDPLRIIPDSDTPLYIDGIRIVVVLPYEGEQWLLESKPSAWTSNIPHGEISRSEILLSFTYAEFKKDVFKRDLHRRINAIKDYASFVNNDISSFNESLEDTIKRLVEQKRKETRDFDEAIKQLGISEETQPEPQPVESKVTVQKTKEPEKELPKPLSDNRYEEILTVIQSTGLQLERTPQTYANHDEEGLRDVFLASLNGHFKGKATGETFNKKGKTDILVRHDNENVFIAECKIWSGQKQFTKAIDQLLGYITWRDTKTAILIFSRRKQISQVLDKIPPAAESHECYNRKMGIEGKSVFRYEFRQREDAKVKILLTVLVFHIPVEKKVKRKPDATAKKGLPPKEEPVEDKVKTVSKKLSEEQILKLPRLSLKWNSWTGGPTNGWFDSAEFSAKNIGGGPIVSMELSITQGNYNAKVNSNLNSIVVGEKQDIVFYFERPRAYELRDKPAPQLQIEFILKDLVGHRIVANYTWDSSDTNNPIIPGAITVDEIPI